MTLGCPLGSNGDMLARERRKTRIGPDASNADSCHMLLAWHLSRMLGQE